MMKYQWIGLLIILFVLSACSGNEIEVIEINNKNFSNALFIQKVVDDSSTEEMTKMVSDQQKIEKILTMVDGLKVEETNTDYMFKEMKSRNTYMFVFTEGEELPLEKEIPYAFNVLEDGTFFFSYKNVNSHQKPRKTIEKHKDLLNEMKQLLEIDF